MKIWGGAALSTYFITCFFIGSISFFGTRAVKYGRKEKDIMLERGYLELQNENELVERSLKEFHEELSRSFDLFSVDPDQIKEDY